MKSLPFWESCCLIFNPSTDEEEIVSMDRLTIHHKEGFKYDLSSVLTKNPSEKCGKLKYQHSWKCGDTDFSLLETSLKDVSQFKLNVSFNIWPIILITSLQMSTEKNLICFSSIYSASQPFTGFCRWPSSTYSCRYGGSYRHICRTYNRGCPVPHVTSTYTWSNSNGFSWSSFAFLAPV